MPQEIHTDATKENTQETHGINTLVPSSSKFQSTSFLITGAACNLSIGDHPYPTIFVVLQGQEVCFVDRSTVFQWTIPQRWYHQNGYGMSFSLATENQKLGTLESWNQTLQKLIIGWQIILFKRGHCFGLPSAEMYMMIKDSPLLKSVPLEDQANGANKTHEGRREGTWRHCSCRLDVNSHLQLW